MNKKHNIPGTVVIKKDSIPAAATPIPVVSTTVTGVSQGEITDLLDELPLAQLSKVILHSQRRLSCAQTSAIKAFLSIMHDNTVCPYDENTLVFTLKPFHLETLPEWLATISNSFLEDIGSAGIAFNMHTVLEPATELVNVRIIISPVPMCLQKVTKDWMNSGDLSPLTSKELLAAINKEK